jgi:hypothetical protein
MGIAIVLPEMVLWCAWEQWWAARRLIKRVAEVQEGKCPEQNDRTGWPCCENPTDGVEETDRKVQEETDRQVQEETDRQVQEETDRQVQEETDRQVQEELEPCEVEAAETSADNIKPPLSKSQKDAGPCPNAPWTLSQAFFALSGGYSIPSSSQSHPHSTLTATGVLFLLHLNLLPQASPSAISDKSKADAIAKVFVCCQTGWFIVQVIARAVAKLPITTLEIHVLVHVVCAFAVYAVWFEKGYDVGEAIIVDGEEGRDLGALLALRGGVVSRCSANLHHCACNWY